LIERDGNEVRIGIGDLGIDRSYVENFLQGKCCVYHFNYVFCNLVANVGFGRSRNGIEDAGGHR